MPHKGDMMTVREIVETLGLAADEDAVRKWQSTMHGDCHEQENEFNGNQRCRRKPGQKYL